ncbi:MAG: bifunctional YncE family protein/alkaline phosphatase family protein [Terriglobia bacterium]
MKKSSLIYKSLVLLFAGGILSPSAAGQHGKKIAMELAAPAVDRTTHIDRKGETVLPNGRLITPSGRLVTVAPHPYGLAASADGKTLVTVNSGTAPFSISIITGLNSRKPEVAQIPPGFKPGDDDPKSVYMGAAIAPDNRTLYVSEGNNGGIGIFDLVTHKSLGAMSLNGEFQGKNYEHSLTGEIRLSPDGKTLYALDIAYFRLVVMDTAVKKVVASVPVGRFPFALALAPDGRHAYVTNVGMFRYSLVDGYDPKDPAGTGIDFPAFGFPSEAATNGGIVDGKHVPGLGDPNTMASNSLWVLDLSNPTQPHVTAKLRTGLPVGDESVGGSSPGGVVAGRQRIYVSNANQDSISIIDTRRMKVEKTMTLQPAAAVRGLRGVLPFGLALSPDEKRLYVACSGINAVAELDAHNGKTLGYIPTGWFPARVAVSPDGSLLYATNAKGFGSGPNGGPDFHEGPEGAYIGDLMKGTVSIIPLPSRADLHSDTHEVLRDNGFLPPAGATLRVPGFPIPPAGTPSSEIHHVVLIVKENRTFDQVFGDLAIPGAHVEADPELTDYGMDSTAVNEKLHERVEHARVTPNHHALARRFAVSDNYYVDSDVSVDGHHWLVGNYPNEVIETGVPAAYGGQFDFIPDNNAPGRVGIGSTSPIPEAFLEAGSLWEHLARHHISFRNYGEDMEMTGDTEGGGLVPTGVREAVNIPMPEVLFENTSRRYPTFNTNISDQYRLKQFKDEFNLRYASGKNPLPQFLFIWLPDDHTADPRPADGYSYRASYVADNDLALGKLVELFSHSIYWKDMAIFVTEDDAQDGTDHVDAHRSLLLTLSPYARRGVSHAHTSMMSILKTIDLIFGLPYLNQYDAAATDLSSMFADKPDFTPYVALPPDLRIFDPDKVNETGAKSSAARSAPLDDPDVIRREMRERQRERE